MNLEETAHHLMVKINPYSKIMKIITKLPFKSKMSLVRPKNAIPEVFILWRHLNDILAVVQPNRDVSC